MDDEARRYPFTFFRTGPSRQPTIRLCWPPPLWYKLSPCLAIQNLRTMQTKQYIRLTAGILSCVRPRLMDENEADAAVAKKRSGETRGRLPGSVSGDLSRCAFSALFALSRSFAPTCALRKVPANVEKGRNEFANFAVHRLRQPILNATVGSGAFGLEFLGRGNESGTGRVGRRA